MKEENKITEEVKQLLDSLEQHGQNVRRQKELSDLIDGLEASGTKHRKLYPLWWIVGAAAACLLLWLLARPALKETPNMNEEILVEGTGSKDTMTTQEEIDFIEESVILEEPVPEKLLAEEQPIQLAKPQTKPHKPTPKAVEKNSEEPLLADNTPVESMRSESVEPTDTSNIGSISTPIVENQLATFNTPLSTPTGPQRRVIRSLNLVCYECKVESEKWKVENAQLSTLPPIRSVSPSGFNFPLEPDPNMKNGSLAFELKLH